MNYLITGGAGFIGSHLAEHILNKNKKHNVVILDDFSTGSKNNIEALLENERFKVIQGTVLDYDLVDVLVSDSDYIYHFASSVGIKYIYENKLKSLDVSTIGARNIFSAATIHKKRVMFSSSSEVYGKRSFLDDENCDKILGSTDVFRWSYSVAKTLAEYYLHVFHEAGLNYEIVRFFNVVGPRQNDKYGMVLPKFIKQALSNDDLTIYGNGEQIRCFTFVKDIVEICYQFSQLNHSTNLTYNVGNNKPLSINTLADMVIDITKSKSKKIHIPYEKIYEKNFEDCEKRIPNITRLLNTITTIKFTGMENIIYEILQNLNHQ